MRFFTLFATFGFAALVAAQDTNSTGTATGTATGSAASASTSLDPQIRCLQKCGSADVCCQAACVNVPCPSQLQANATTECAAQCPQGNGTAAETEQYAECQAACISANFLTNSATATATTTGDASASTGSFDFNGGGGEATATGASASGNGAASSTSGSSGAAQTGNSADSLHVGAVGLGFLSLVVAGLAL